MLPEAPAPADGAHDAAEIPLEWVSFAPSATPISPDAAIATALTILGVPDALRGMFTNLVRFVVVHESGWKVNAVNRWDSNAVGALQADGAPLQSSRGWMQTIPQTFAKFHVRGTAAAIYDPVANICAALNYMSTRYNVSLLTGQGIEAFLARSIGGYIGY